MNIRSGVLSPAAIVTMLRAAGCVFAEDEARLLVAAAQTPEELSAMVDRRREGLPLEHVLGWAEFRGLRIAVETGVFVPRQRTEYLVHQAIDLVSAQVGAVIVDLCCGSGALGVAIAAAVREPELHASDIDAASVRCARRNLAAVGGSAYLGDLYRALPGSLRGRVDVLVANVPYVPTDAMPLLPPEARDHEPQVALDGGADGLDVLRRVAAEAPQWLAPGGHLLIETSRRQAPQALDALARTGLSPRMARCEESNATVVIATNAASRLLAEGQGV